MKGPRIRHLVFRLEGVVMRTVPAPSRVTPGMAELVEELGADFDLWLFCESPEAELAPVLESLQLDRLVPRNHWLFPSEGFRGGEQSGRVKGGLVPKGLVEGIRRRTGARREGLLVIDDRPAVTAAAIRTGINAVAFVDASRLRRNLVLRGLVR